MRKQQGFTIPELIIAVVLVAILGLFAFNQEQAASASRRDEYRKVSINAMYFYLEEVYFAQYKAYPVALTTANTKGIDPDLLRDNMGRLVGDKNASFRYEPSECTGDVCKRYTLRAELEKEDDFVRESRHK